MEVCVATILTEGVSFNSKVYLLTQMIISAYLVDLSQLCRNTSTIVFQLSRADLDTTVSVQSFMSHCLAQISVELN